MVSTKLTAEQLKEIADLEPDDGVFIDTPIEEEFGSSRSGNWAHKGTPGSRGGSAPGGGSVNVGGGAYAGTLPTAKGAENDYSSTHSGRVDTPATDETD